MTGQTPPPPTTWDAVLAAVEADVQRTEQMLRPGVPTVAPAPAPALTPAELMLPSGEPYLPPLSEMPPVPPELLHRITELRAHIDELQADLERCLAAARRADRISGRPHLVASATTEPHFVDRRA